MDFVMALAPVVIAGGIALFVVLRAKHKYNQGEFDKKKSNGDNDMTVILIPLGMTLGCGVGIVVGTFFPISFMTTGSLGAGLGYLCGYFAYESYMKTSQS